MIARRFLLAFAPLLFALGVALDATARPVATVEVAGPRVRIGDLGLAATRGISDIDLGPTPLPGGSRMVTRDPERTLRSCAHARHPDHRR